MERFKSFIFLLVLFAFIFVFKASAQTPPVQDAQSWKCLKGDEKTFTFNGADSATVTEDWYADGYQFDNDAYIVSCVGTEAGGVCSTGDPNYDELLFKNDNTKLFPYSVSVKGGAKQKIVLGKLRVTATATTGGLTGGMAFYSVTLNDLQGALGQGAGQKLSTFPFGEGSFTKCVTISWNTILPTATPVPQGGGGGGGGGQHNKWPNWHRGWDPFGIVFDSQSLEPLPNIKVTIYDKDKIMYSSLGLTNPQTTKADGLFNFLVEPGTYYLKTSLPAGYSFTATPNLQPNYIKIYHKEDGTNSIYKPDEPIVEDIDTPQEVANGRPDIEHRDVPLDPGSGQPYIAEPSTILYKVLNIGGKTTIDGRVSHPFTQVTFSQGNSVLSEEQSDRYGYYLTEIENSKIIQGTDISVTYVKADLKNINVTEITWQKFLKFFVDLVMAPFSSPASAQTSLRITPSTSTFTIPPILSYISGYAYDSSGKIAPLAKVLLKLKMNNATVYETKADNKGYFQISSKFIPVLPYSIQIIPVGGSVVSYTTTQFVKQNEKYLTDAKINLVQPNLINKPGATASGSTNAGSNPSSSSNSQFPTSTQKQTGTASKTPSLFLFIFIIFFCLIGAIVLGYFILKSRNPLA